MNQPIVKIVIKNVPGVTIQTETTKGYETIILDQPDKSDPLNETIVVVVKAKRPEGSK